MRLLGVDVGTGSTKGVIVDECGMVTATASREHATSSPRPGWYEHDPESVWWDDIVMIVRQLLDQSPGGVDGVGVSGIGPALLVTDGQDRPLRPAILYGIDTRSQRQITDQIERFGADELLRRSGNRLTTQAVGPKLQWIAENEAEIWRHARRFYSTPSWAVRRLTGEYTLDRYSASSSDPLYDLSTGGWWEPAWNDLGNLTRPALLWPGEIAGQVTMEAAEATGLPIGTPVIAGTVDALAEAYSVGVRAIGDTMVMYGSTMFLIQVLQAPVTHPGLWAAVGRQEGTYSSCAGLATSGLITSWLTNVTGSDFGTLAHEAREVPAGSDGLILLPYFEGERTPVFDPNARGAWVGLTLRHSRGHLYRSTLEGVAHGVRHNLDTMSSAGAAPQRLVAVGGGTRQNLWLQIVSDVTGLAQDVPTITVGASYGDARLIADALGVDTDAWNPVARRIVPDPTARAIHDDLHTVYMALYPQLADSMHRLARLSGDPATVHVHATPTHTDGPVRD